MGITLAEARERLGEAKRMVADGKLPAREKTRDKARVKGAGCSGQPVPDSILRFPQRQQAKFSFEQNWHAHRERDTAHR